MTTRRTARKLENRGKLLGAARKVFSDKGYAAATARDIVRETDLASGTFYNYFDDKEAAFRAVLEEFTTEARTIAREQRVKPGVGVEDRLYNAYRAFFELVVSDPQTFEFLRRNSDVIAYLGAEDMFEDAVRELVEDMREWAAAGEIPQSAERWFPYVARSLAGGAFQIGAQMSGATESDVDATARFCARLLLNGLRRLS